MSVKPADDDQLRWASAKERIRAAYRRTPTSLIFVWRDCWDGILEKSDTEVLEGLADYAELCADVLLPDEDSADLQMHLDDESLRRTFSVMRLLERRVDQIKSQCRYCGTKESRMLRWTTTTGLAIERDLPLDIYVCRGNDPCREAAYAQGYKLERTERRHWAKQLAGQGKTIREMAEILRVSRQTLRKDLRHSD